MLNFMTSSNYCFDPLGKKKKKKIIASPSAGLLLLSRWLQEQINPQRYPGTRTPLLKLQVDVFGRELDESRLGVYFRTPCMCNSYFTK